ncbi:MAG TPA: FtsQ-type POTRA domain-containing protein [Clostridiales bacterium]|nr:FtsQ-type POTRA domain-containing protein [Clostridiales bacterium]
MIESSADKKTKRKKKKGIYILLLLLCSFSFMVIFKTDLFSIKHVYFKGNHQLSRETLLEQSGIAFGNNIFREKMKQIESNMQQHPYIKTAKARRVLPDTIQIQIWERVETAAVPFMGEYLLIDEEGVVLRTSPDPQNLKVIQGLEFKNFIKGQALNTKDSVQFQRALQIIKYIDKHQIPVMKIDMTNKDQAIIHFSDLLKAELGECANIDYKFLLLKKILENLAEQDITRGVIDISHEGYPSYRPVE